MSKEQLQKITFEQLVEKSMQRERDKMKVKVVEIPSMGGTLLLQKIAEKKVLEILDSVQSDQNLVNIIGEERKLIYLCCPMLQDTKLHEALGVSDPLDVVAKLFDIKETELLAKAAMELNGAGDMTQKADEIKNL